MKNRVIFALLATLAALLMGACSATTTKPEHHPAPQPNARETKLEEPALPKFNLYPTTSHGDNIHPAYARLDANIPPAKVAITFVPTLHGKLAPEYLGAISGVFHHDLWGSDYVGSSTAMFAQGGGHYSTRARAYAEYGSGWRILYWVLGQKQIVRGPALRPNQEGVIDFGAVEVKIENFLAGRVLCKGNVLHESGTPFDPALIDGVSFRAHIARRNCPDFEEGVSATINADGSFKFAIPFEPDTYRKSRTLTLEEIRSATLISRFGGEWRVVGERDGVLDFGTQTIGGRLVTFEANLKLPKPYHWSDMPAPDLSKSRDEAIAIDAPTYAANFADFFLSDSANNRLKQCDAIYLGAGRFGGRLFCEDVEIIPSISFKGGPEQRITQEAAPIKALGNSAQAIHFEVEMPNFWYLYISRRWRELNEPDAERKCRIFSSSQIRVHLDAKGATLPEGAELQLSVGKWSDFRQSVRFIDGKFESVTLDRSLMVRSDNDGSIDLVVVDQNGRWGFPYGPLCEPVEVKNQSSPQEVTLKLTAKPEFAGPIEGPFSFAAYCGGVRCELPWSVKFAGEEVSARDLWRKLDAIEGNLYPYYGGEWGNKEKKYQIKRTGPTSYRVDVDASREVTISDAYFKRFDDVWLEFGIGGREVRFWPKRSGKILVSDFVENSSLTLGGSLFGQEYEFESREVPSRQTPIEFADTPTIVHTKGTKRGSDWYLRSLDNSTSYSIADYRGNWRAVPRGRYSLWFDLKGVATLAKEEIIIPDQKEPFVLEVPDVE